ncbi:MAG: ribonuclease R [Rikenellaceae bacterium]|jgi:ribonuclease R|nr:ribonuclease R [Rikenellaceae bacterium]
MPKKKKINKSRNDDRQRQGGKPADFATLVADLFRAFPDKKYTLRTLTSSLGGSSEAKYEARETIEKLLAQGLIEEAAPGKYRLHHAQAGHNKFEGVVDMHSSGAMHVKVQGLDNDVFVSERQGRHALHGDRVEVIVLRTRGGVAEGEIIRILERSPRLYAGTLEMSQGFAFLKPDTRKIPADIYLTPAPGAQLKSDMKVAVRIVDWPMNMKNPLGEIVDVLGMAGENNAEMHAILTEFDLPYKFEKEVIDAAEAIPGEITAQDYAERCDVRGVPTFTIDPADAKDFDDALSIRRTDDGMWEVGVHIADVTHYVREGSIVEAEGLNRATSVYLVDRTVPMLPERLSNVLCSLRPGEEKLCFSAIFRMDENANVLDRWLGRTVILSDRRFAYEEAQQIIEGAPGAYAKEVLALHGLAQQLRKERFKNGSITFEREEAKFKLDEKGNPLGVYFKEQKESNQLIEEFMLLANRNVAEFVGKTRGVGANAKRTMVYRVHDKPNEDKLARFASFILRFGYYFKLGQDSKVAPQMNKLMGQIHGKPEENVVSTLAIRTMAKAYYSTDNIGHYGLSFPYYTHFTSPIRRYPDMMVHRLLARYLAGGKSADKSHYEQLCEHSSDMEVRAAEAERASVRYKMVEFMQDRIGQEFIGVISGVTEWGVYVELEDTHIEGMVSVRDMKDDYYSYSEDDYAIKGKASGRTFTLGDRVRISVLRADLQRKQLDFGLVASYDFDSGKAIPIVMPEYPVKSSPHPRRRPGRK